VIAQGLGGPGGTGVDLREAATPAAKAGEVLVPRGLLARDVQVVTGLRLGGRGEGRSGQAVGLGKPGRSARRWFGQIERVRANEKAAGPVSSRSEDCGLRGAGLSSAP
jgi:hypothetical protein